MYNQPTETDPAEEDEDEEDMGMGEEQMDDNGEMMGTSQMSNTPISHHKGDLDGSQNMNEASMVTANLRNFIEEAQPADALLNSQSHYGTSS